MIRLTGAPKQHWGHPEPVGPQRQRKVALIGSHSGTIHFAPYRDPSWDVWVHSSCAQLVPRGRADRLFDVHPRHCFEVARKNGFADYYGYLKASKIPIYMQEQFPEIPASVRYPVEMVRSLYPDMEFGSQTAWMIALALTEGVTQLGLWGIHYDHGSDYAESRANCEQWVGYAKGQGVRVLIPQESPLTHGNPEDYAYQTHDTPEKYAARVEAFRQSVRNFGKLQPTQLEPCDTPEALAAAEAIRREKDPEWAKFEDSLPASERMPAWMREEERKARVQMGLEPAV
jgi:hypothetical protein